jgi:hypothetical protein
VHKARRVIREMLVRKALKVTKEMLVRKAHRVTKGIRERRDHKAIRAKTHKPKYQVHLHLHQKLAIYGTIAIQASYLSGTLILMVVNGWILEVVAHKVRKERLDLQNILQKVWLFLTVLLG